MKSLIDKVGDLLPVLEARGEVYLFAFAEREDVNLWDVVLSSSWSDKDWTAAIRFVADELWPRLESQERTMISRIAIVSSDDPKILEMPDSLDNVTPEERKVIHITLLGSDIRHAYIFRSRRPRWVSPGAAGTSAMAQV